MIGLIVLYFLFTFFLAINKPSFFVIFYLLNSTKFLGFFDVEYYFVLGGIGLAMPLLNVITIISFFFTRKRSRIPKKISYFIIAFLVFLLYGIIQPFYLDNESILQAIITSKEFWYISILFYLFFNNKSLDKLLLIKFIKFVGIYFALVYIIYYLFKIGPIFYLEGTRVRCFFPTYLSLTLFLYVVDFKKNKINFFKFFIIFVILFIGLILAGHFSLLLGTCISLIILFIVLKQNTLSLDNILFKIFTFITLISIVFLFFSNFRNKTTSTFENILNGTDASLVSRETYNGFRWEAINKRPLSGYGFLHKDAPISRYFRTIEENRFAESFGVIDSGYVDLLIKFGYIGMIFYLLLWANLIFPILLRPSKYHLLQISMAAYLVQYFIINYTWSVFSFAHGLLPAFIAVFLINENLFKKKYVKVVKLN